MACGRRKWRDFYATLVVAFSGLASAVADEPIGGIGPFSPDDALAHFQLHSDCRIELVASEPDVIDPVHIAFDAAGRMWVVEYSDYPHGPGEGQPGASRIRVLTDANHDGRYDSPQIFAEKLLFATGLLPWRDGVIVTTAGQVLFLRDTDGDARADDLQEWFRGFTQENPQLRANHPTLSIDGGIYIASGLRGGEVGPGQDWAAAFHRDAANLPAAVPLGGRDFRFDPLTGDFESVTGPGQFGLAFNDWGDRFVCDNRHPCRQIVFEEQQLKRNPKFAPTETATDVLPSGEASRLFPISRTWTTSNLHANQFTAACGLCLYRGDSLPADYYGNAFVCDPTANLVHRAIVEAGGAVHSSHRDREGIEFLATQDEWFRPVNLTIGPDGALYVVDMYRAVIEHPQFMPEELQKRPDLLLGTDKGRIYRIVAAKSDDRAPAAAQWPLPTDVESLCRLLEHPNCWQRDLAFSHLLATPRETALSSLAQIAVESALPAARAAALRLLQRRNELTPDVLLQALQAEDPQVQRQAVLVGAESSPTPQFTADVARLGQMTDHAALRFAVALSRPDLGGESAAGDLRGLLDRAPIDPWISQAVATAPPELVNSILTHGETPPAHRAAFEPLLEVAGATAEPQQLGDALHSFSDPASLARLAAGLRRRGKRFADVLPQLPDEPASRVRAWLAASRQQAADPNCDESERLTAIAAMAHDDWDQCGDAVLQLARTEVNATLRAAAIDLLAQFRTVDIGTLLADDFAGMPPSVRSAALRALLASPARVQSLLDAIAAENIPPLLIDPATVKRLLTTGEASQRERAQQLFASLTPAARKAVLEQYQSCLTLESDPLRGRAVFQTTCITCHKIGNLGVDVAPDISDSRTKTREFLLTAILDPNQAIDNNYFSYTVVDADGIVHTGVLATETSTSITLKQPEGKTVTISRDRIEQLKSNGVSLMPEGLERNITPQQMADLISFIKNWRYLDGSVPQEVIR